jgi:hypothetical protein
MSKFLGGIAADIYSQSESGSSSVQSFIPRSKFQFETKIYYKGSSAPLVLNRISEIGMPSVIFRTIVMNQYNKKRLANTGVEYQPISINAYDTRDAQIEKFLKKYAEYYYDGPLNDPNGTVQSIDDIISAGFTGGSSGRGLKLLDERFYISRIEIHRSSSANDNNIITLWNPLITSIQGDTLSYSDSNPVQYRIEISYEGYDIHTEGTRTPGQGF